MEKGIDIGLLKRLRKFMEQGGLSEMEVEMDGIKVRMRKAGSVDAAPESRGMVVPSQAAGNEQAVARVPNGSPGEPAPVNVEMFSVVKAPMVGTFYRSPSPQDSPFVNEGDVIKEGQTLCMIEAMKLMNEIKAEKAGKIVKVLVENGQPVEFDQPLFELEPAGGA